MQLKDVMTPGVEVIAPEASMYEAAEKMRRLDIGPLPVCDGERLVGMLTNRDPTTRRPLLEILADTERHASELADYLKSTSEVRA
jgi:CBS domain-containing protein